MIPSRLTLLSKEKRKYLDRILYIQFFKSSLESLVFILCISGITLLGTQWVLQEHFNKLASGLAVSNSKQAESNQKIKKANRIIQQTKDLQSIYTHWTPILTTLGNSIPENVIINSMSLDKDGGEFVINGVADTRDDLLLLQTNLEALPLIESAPVPLSQLTSQKDVSFSIKMKLAAEKK